MLMTRDDGSSYEMNREFYERVSAETGIPLDWLMGEDMTPRSDYREKLEELRSAHRAVAS